MPGDDEILRKRDEWFAEEVARIQAEGDWKLGLGFVILSLLAFSSAQFVA